MRHLSGTLRFEDEYHHLWMVGWSADNDGDGWYAALGSAKLCGRENSNRTIDIPLVILSDDWHIDVGEEVREHLVKYENVPEYRLRCQWENLTHGRWRLKQ